MLGTGFYIDEVEDRLAEVQQQIDANVRHTLMFIFGVALAFFAIAALMGYVFAGAMTRPLKVPTDALQNIAEGDGDLPQRIDTTGSKEITAVNDGFNRFVDKVHIAISEVSNSASGIAASS